MATFSAIFRLISDQPVVSGGGCRSIWRMTTSHWQLPHMSRLGYVICNGRDFHSHTLSKSLQSVGV